MTDLLNNNTSVLEQSLVAILSKEEIQQWLKTYALPFKELMAYYRCAMMTVETKFNVLNEELGIQYDHNPIESIRTRLKSPESIIEKMFRRGFDLSIESIEENLNDIAGVRVVCPFSEDVYMLADALLRQDDITLVQKKDYIRSPKPNGYRSLHLIVTVPIFLAKEKRIVRVEIQLRTISMDSWASLEHRLRYKRNVSFTDSMAQELLRCAQLSAEFDARMDRLKNLCLSAGNHPPEGENQ